MFQVLCTLMVRARCDYGPVYQPKPHKRGPPTVVSKAIHSVYGEFGTPSGAEGTYNAGSWHVNVVRTEFASMSQNRQYAAIQNRVCVALRLLMKVV